MFFKKLWEAIEQRSYKSDYDKLNGRYWELEYKVDKICEHLGIEVVKVMQHLEVRKKISKE